MLNAFTAYTENPNYYTGLALTKAFVKNDDDNPDVANAVGDFVTTHPTDEIIKLAAANPKLVDLL